MTDKQIIIFGVDVSGCKHYKHNDKNSGWSSCTSKDEEHIHAVNPLCCEKKDCLYKQLKAKEQECETLASQLDFEVQKKECLEQECEELKERLNCNCFDPKNNNNRCISYNRIAEDYERDLRQLDQLKEQLEAYKMEAEEGKEINAELKVENDELKKKLAFLIYSPSCYKYKQAELFKQTLIEIKEITRKTLWNYPNLDDVTKCNMFDKILQKISEVGGE